jgi:hypothetical protein
MATENTAHRESPPDEGTQTRMHTQLAETERTPHQNGFEFANDQITGAAHNMNDPRRGPTQLPQTTAGAKYPWPENGFVFSNDGSLLSIHNGVCPIAVMRPGFQWRAPVSGPKSRRKKRPVLPHYN